MAENKHEIGRRSLLVSAGSLAAMPLLGGIGSQAFAEGTALTGPRTAMLL
jgi:hypothetical protein